MTLSASFGKGAPSVLHLPFRAHFLVESNEVQFQAGWLALGFWGVLFFWGFWQGRVLVLSVGFGLGVFCLLGFVVVIGGFGKMNV